MQKDHTKSLHALQIFDEDVLLRHPFCCNGQEKSDNRRKTFGHEGHQNGDGECDGGGRLAFVNGCDSYGKENQGEYDGDTGNNDDESRTVKVVEWLIGTDEFLDTRTFRLRADFHYRPLLQ